MSKKTRREKQSAICKPTTEKLAEALLKARAPDEMIAKAKSGAYDDFKSGSATPIIDLVRDAIFYGLPDIVERAKQGEFDAQKWEGDEWMRSPEGQLTFEQLVRGE